MQTGKIIKNPRITEKASDLMAGNVYAFDVAESVNRKEVEKAVFSIYKVHPQRVSILPIPKKSVFARGKKGVRKGGKKALVYLKEGDKIEFV